MSRPPRPSPTKPAGARRRLGLVCALVFAAAFFVSGCHFFHREPPRPGRTVLDSPLVIVPATTMSNYLVIEAKWDKHGPYHFLIDTGASVTLVTPEFAARHVAKDAPPTDTPLVRVKSADGETALLNSTTLRRIELGEARFEYVQALVYDCAAISAHLGVQIDGILGFPLFRETLLTLDYPNSRILLQPSWGASLFAGTPVAFTSGRNTPIVPVQVGDETIVALIDSGSDTALSLNPVGLQPAYAVRPRPGATVASLTGDRDQQIGRLGESLTLADYPIDRPVVELTDELTSIGGRLLRNFTVTFDQERSQVTLHRDTHAPIPPAPLRHVGLSFSKTPAYWRVASVVPNSPAAEAGVQPGDLIIRINGEPVGKWTIVRYQQLIDAGGEVSLTFLNGTRETNKRIQIFDLVP